MDAIDRRLLNLLQKDSRQTAEQLAQRVPLSATAITRRLQRMRTQGSIDREVALVPVKLREQRLTAVSQVQFERHTPSELSEQKRMLVEAPEVLICVSIPATSDMMTAASMRDMDHFNAFADELASQPPVRRYESSFVKWHSSERVRRGFCVTCGSLLFWKPIHRDWIGIAMGAFDGPTETHLHVHVYVSQKGDYYEIADGVPQFATVPPPQ